MENITISINDLSFSFDKTPILEDVNLQIEKGQFIGFIGPNGGGKTTLLKLIIGLLQSQTGTIKVLGENPKDIRSKIGYVPQVINVDRNFPISVYELVLLGGISESKFLKKYPKNIKDKALDFLEKMDLLHLKNKSFGQLSGGEFQKALIARALISDPDILVLDEPTANIDVIAEKKIFDLILQYKGKKTILIVSHDLEIIIEHVKEVVFVQRKVMTKLPEEVCEHFALGLYHKPYLKK